MFRWRLSAWRRFRFCGNVDSAGMTRWYEDLDGDGYGDDNDPGTLWCDDPGGASQSQGDCDDSEAEANEGFTTEVCGDGLDNDCNGDATGCDLFGQVELTQANAWWSAGAETGLPAAIAIVP